MSYEGVKFNLVRLSDELPHHPWLPELQKWCVMFDEHGLAPFYDGGSHGNLSFRSEPGSNSFYITAAHSSLKESVTDDFFFRVDKADISKFTIHASGCPDKKPSSESMLHGALYQKRPDIMAILHGHCKSISRNSEQAGIITTRNFVESGTKEIIESVLEVLNRAYFIEIRDHGFISMGRTISDAGVLALEMMKKSDNIS